MNLGIAKLGSKRRASELHAEDAEEDGGEKEEDIEIEEEIEGDEAETSSDGRPGGEAEGRVKSHMLSARAKGGSARRKESDGFV